MTEEEKQKVIEKLTERGVKLTCPRCGQGSFAIVEGYFKQIIQKDLTNTMLSGPGIPSIMTVCTNCGFISQHALGALGLLPDKKIKIKEKK